MLLALFYLPPVLKHYLVEFFGLLFDLFPPLLEFCFIGGLNSP
jgi:hypothetical protein